MKTFITFILFVLTVSSGYCESLSDINVSRLQESAKEKWGRDPFLKYEHRNEKMIKDKRDISIGVRIDGIISNGKKALAIINGGFYRKGDKIGDYVIKDISNEKVLIENKGKKYYFGIERFAMNGGKK